MGFRVWGLRISIEYVTSRRIVFHLGLRVQGSDGMEWFEVQGFGLIYRYNDLPGSCVG